MSRCPKFAYISLAALLCFSLAASADTQTTHRSHAKKKALPPPLPSGTQGPVPQVPLDSIAPIPPQVTYEGGLLTIVAPNSTLGDILRSVRKHTDAEIDVPATATERVVTSLGPAPPSEVMAELLNGSRFNYVLLGSPTDANALVKVVLVAKTADTPPAPASATAASGAAPVTPAANAAEAGDADSAEDNADDNSDQPAAEAEQPATNPDQPGVKTPQQMLQEMQQRQLQLQQQQANQPGNVPPPPGMPAPHQPGSPQQDQ